MPIASNAHARCGLAHGDQAAASALIASIASLKPPLVSDEPATRLTEISSMSSPDDDVRDAADELALVLLGLALLRVARVTSTSVMTSSSSVTVTEIVSTDSGVA